MQSPAPKRRCKRRSGASASQLEAMLPTEDSNINKNSINLNGKKKSNGVVSITKLRQTDKDVIRIIGQHLIDLGLQLASNIYL